ncbi:hypothetical protein F4781DRAFT_426824 [Annulohypoxylon bovei var. microspora]|nr:hypothetical protein F4781DRAFT_426824 [Annulohypoxylon bovei var. microspora]
MATPQAIGQAGTTHADRVELFDYVETSRTHEERFHFLGFEFLHRLNIVRLQTDLIEMKNTIFATRCTDFDEEKLNKLLHDYTTAVRNYNYVHEAQRLDEQNMENRKQRLKFKFKSLTTKYRQTRPFESHYLFLHGNSENPTPDIMRDTLRKWLPARLSYSTEERQYRSKEFEEGDMPMEISPFVDKLVRLLVSLMAPSPTKSLVTSSIFMFLFACSLSFGIKTSNVETMVATATYSAVLVVFVGTNS